ncbi:hypothetical protein DFJ74DRAFT_661871 [Hyaloraphidium curvatum]|nr:hypothetical protein DFJ74DRAFT_661871 [Hyaloraphidium curvatum]
MMRIDGGGIAGFDGDAWAREQGGLRPLGIRRTRMLDVFLGAAKADGVPVHAGMPLAGIGHDPSDPSKPVVARFADGTEVEGDALIGCDGLHSKVREVLWGKQPASYTGVLATLGIARGPDGDTMKGYQGKGMFAGIYGVGKGELQWFVGEKAGQERATETWNADYSSASENAEWFAKQGFPADVVDLVASSFRIIRFAVWDRPPLPRWGRGKVTLVGDAAHPTSPHLGQGANMALEDAGVLSELLRRMPRDPAGAFEVYERLRRARTAQIVRSARQMGEINSLRNPIACAVRDAAMAAAIRVLGAPPVGAMHGYDYKAAVEKALGPAPAKGG